MSDPTSEDTTPQAALAQAGQALLLARIVASVVAFGWFFAGEAALANSGKFEAMFAELGTDAELPLVSTFLLKGRDPLVVGFPLLFAATLFFIWARGRTAAWMAGIGLLLLTLIAPLTAWGLFAPLLKILTEMGNM
jgi:hypothetical protein